MANRTFPESGRTVEAVVVAAVVVMLLVVALQDLVVALQDSEASKRPAEDSEGKAGRVAVQTPLHREAPRPRLRHLPRHRRHQPGLQTSRLATRAPASQEVCRIRHGQPNS
jgi:hypothetical protein